MIAGAADVDCLRGFGVLGAADGSVLEEMFGSWNPMGFQVRAVLVATALVLLLQIESCCSINGEGLVLLRFRMRVEYDPLGALASWNYSNHDPCQWNGVGCVDGEVQFLELKDYALGGMLAPELGKLSNLRSLVLLKNNFFGAIPKEIGMLTMLEVLDLRGNKLSGKLPVEMGDMPSLKFLLLCDNQFHGCIPTEFGKLKTLVAIQYDETLTSDVESGISCLNRKFRPWINFRRFLSQRHRQCCYNYIEGLSETYIEQKVLHFSSPSRRNLLQNSNSNLAAALVSSIPSVELSNVPSLGSGSFPAIDKKLSPSPQVSPPVAISSHPPPSTLMGGQPTSTNSQQKSKDGSGKWKYLYVLPAGAFLLTVAAALLCIFRRRGGTNIGPWKTGLSGQLQKAFVTGVPKLNRSELETACEDFSNIIGTLPDCMLYKGTLSSGVEIAVASTTIASTRDWSKRAETHFRKKIDALSRVNHKNFVNLLGYCKEDEPFLRMMVLEYAPSGSLFDHLHVKEFEHLDWAARVRIIMGVAYCLQYMHHEVNPPIPHSNLTSNSVYLTDDNAAKIGEFNFWKEFIAKGKVYEDEDSNSSELALADPESNVYSFGVLLLEITSGKLPYSEEQGSLVKWASQYLSDRRTISYMVDPSLKSFKNNELDVICEVILECINQDPRKRPTMKDVTDKLRGAVGISPEAATPKLSPLWWAELEILSLEAS